jgi:tetratricopeptide (TPR) repeat protein
MSKKDLLSYIHAISLAIIALTAFFLPVFFLINTTDFFIFPKQILIVGATVLLLILASIKMILEKKIVLLSNPFNLPVVLFGTVIAVSSIFSINRYDALLQAVPVIALAFFFFEIINTIKTKRSLNILLFAVVAGASVASLASILYYLKFYFLPFTQIQSQLFTPFGSSIQQALYIIPLLIFSASMLLKKIGFPRVKLDLSDIQEDKSIILNFVATLVLLAGVGLVIYQIIALPQKPIILPYIYGFQTAFAALSQDTSRFLLSFVFGSGYGTFLTDFTRFKLASFNLEQNLWNLNFSFSSSYFLELIATLGLAGAASYLFILISFIKTRATTTSPLFKALLIVFVLSIILPFSFIMVSLLFILLALYVSFLRVHEDKKVDELSLSIVALKNGLFAFEEEQARRKGENTMVLSGIIAAILILIAGFTSYFTLLLVNSDIKFAESLQQANLNNGQKTYQLQTAAITEFPYRSDYHRIFSQVNLALANSLVASVPQGQKPDEAVQKNILQLLQQSIASARNAVTISPLTSLNWQNLGQIYRNLINVGENADQFAIASLNQAIALDQYNPQLYIQLGGIYYQLGQYDAAQNQFQIAVSLKRDFANGYYNLGHALEEKGDLQNALQAYQVVQQLVKNDKTSLESITAEIEALQEKAKNLDTGKAAEISGGENQPPLNLSTPSTEIPAQNPPVKISPPPGTSATSSSTLTPAQ